MKTSLSIFCPGAETVSLKQEIKKNPYTDIFK